MPDCDAGSARMFWILRLLRSLGCSVAFLPLNRVRPEPYTSDLRGLGVDLLDGAYALPREPHFDLAFLSRPSVAAALLRKVRRHSPEAVVAYDTVDLHFLRDARRVAIWGHSSLRQRLGNLRARHLELSLVRRCDLTITVTGKEAEVLRSYVPNARFTVIPTIHEHVQRVPPFDGRADLLFIGGFRHEPNVDAVLYFARDILPLVRRELDVRLWVIGSNVPPDIIQLNSEAIIVKGYVPDLTPYLNATRVFVCPVRYGAGMKGKNGQAMSFGLPIVTTRIGAEGMELVDGRHALVRDDPPHFARAVIQLYRCRELWESISRNAIDVSRERWSPAVATRRLQDLLTLLPARITVEDSTAPAEVVH